MPKFVHELPEAKTLFETLAAERKLLPLVVEKEYESMSTLLLAPGPTFRELMDRLRAQAESF